ncbi:hypothetical protein CDD83_4120 [Cordyceps sp. RAO-2017]|nr:hypothetical protein CDD83_4120 [Cordyceps sp. RAO-2017]
MIGRMTQPGDAQGQEKKDGGRPVAVRNARRGSDPCRRDDDEPKLSRAHRLATTASSRTRARARCFRTPALPRRRPIGEAQTEAPEEEGGLAIETCRLGDGARGGSQGLCGAGPRRRMRRSRRRRRPARIPPPPGHHRTQAFLSPWSVVGEKKKKQGSVPAAGPGPGGRAEAGQLCSSLARPPSSVAVAAEVDEPLSSSSSSSSSSSLPPDMRPRRRVSRLGPSRAEGGRWSWAEDEGGPLVPTSKTRPVRRRSRGRAGRAGGKKPKGPDPCRRRLTASMMRPPAMTPAELTCATAEVAAAWEPRARHLAFRVALPRGR